MWVVFSRLPVNIANIYCSWKSSNNICLLKKVAFLKKNLKWNSGFLQTVTRANYWAFTPGVCSVICKGAVRLQFSFHLSRSTPDSNCLWAPVLFFIPTWAVVKRLAQSIASESCWKNVLSSCDTAVSHTSLVSLAVHCYCMCCHQI